MITAVVVIASIIGVVAWISGRQPPLPPESEEDQANRSL